MADNHGDGKEHRAPVTQFAEWITGVWHHQIPYGTGKNARGHIKENGVHSSHLKWKCPLPKLHNLHRIVKESKNQTGPPCGKNAKRCCPDFLHHGNQERQTISRNQT